MQTVDFLRQAQEALNKCREFDETKQSHLADVWYAEYKRIMEKMAELNSVEKS